MFFLNAFSPFLQTGNPHDSTYFTGPNAFFDFSNFKKKNRKIASKISEKLESRKMTKNDHQGGPRMAQNAKKWIWKNLKNKKIAKKRSFLRNQFFSKFWVAKKLEKTGHDHL